MNLKSSRFCREDYYIFIPSPGTNFVFMIRHILKFPNFLILSFLLSSCEKDINIKLNPTITDLVVDGAIESAKFPVITLSTSLGYFSRIDPHVLSEHFVHGANVTMSNGKITAKLYEDSVRNDSSGILIYYYTFNRADSTQSFYGEFNTQYDLKIVVANKTYTATTTIPALLKLIDSIWWAPVPDPKDSNYVNVKARITDPPGFGNYTRYYTSVNSAPFLPGLNSVFDDQITDGTTYSVNIPQGVNRNNKIDTETYGFFQKGSAVIVKFANIDQGTYNFWRTMEYNYSSLGNPFSTPTEVISNISNGALGYFGGYANQFKFLTIPF